MAKIFERLRPTLGRVNDAVRTGGLSERRQDGGASCDDVAESMPDIRLTAEEKQKVVDFLKSMDFKGIVDQVVGELDREYPPMDESFDSSTAHQAARMALDKLVENISGTTGKGAI